MTEQSHKREMSDAVRGDFERLRARRERRRRGGPAPPVAKPDRVVLTPPRPAVEAVPKPAEPRAEAPPAHGLRRSWLRSVLRRG